jgi:hypothetical protein
VAAFTADLIKTGQYDTVLHGLKPELDSLRGWLNDQLPAQAPEDGELQEILWRIKHDYVRYNHSALLVLTV